MGSNRAKHRMSRVGMSHRQEGITVIGFLVLAAVFGLLGLAVIKIVPLYMERMRVHTVLDDLKTQLSDGGNSPQDIRRALDSRMVVESLNIPSEEISIMPGGQGYVVRIKRESRAPFFADLSFVVDIDDKVEIRR